MTAPPGLQTEDRPDFERALHQALRTAEIREALRRDGATGDADIQRLRAQALVASELIATAAAPEYAAYLRQRAAATTTASTVSTVSTASALSGSPTPSAGVRGLLPVLAVLTPALAGASTAAFLLLGGLLGLLDSQRDLADALLTAGLTSATIAAFTLVVGVACLLVTAVRHRTPAPDQRPCPRPRPHGRLRLHRHPPTHPPHLRRRDDAAVATARDAWLRALLHRGILPFLRDRLERSHSPSRTSQQSERGTT
ncbi:hypothetical protein [Streptomyces rapamycinicus]|uniref:Transmembrane protein n=2 Tax=Streptomyces rapamycinicus TaxID=1226757 RepID=A0A0A0NKW7_STRRN|nr:hypothetical protein [Streptomyces rapamycinicus]AGP56753.1 hypothetical protein M271_26370 [Streptomyces rapamycinicus NRRL 5491]MBB4784364.1 hypothetical protein [Streptomyces rapamycinicus]RLV80152.1 hypothetical protein D3C57_117245 [Streptomyces rapamycinicus NRRL 5491]UTO64681.1 hypothetical protein LJB45_21680 [Streptomyces rapamycinicus]UTP32637.1 hypothetical protein LIV37_26805 [Streptomyces rapamycinicus NRRL 5491]